MNKKLKPPRNIYLQNYFEDFGFYDEGVTWCEDKQNDDDIEYILQLEYDKLNEETKRLMDEVKESNGLLRSASMIAKRDGKETNWEAWRKQLYIALERQHAMMYGKDNNGD